MSGKERGRAAERVTMEQIQQMPALLSTDDYSRITGETPFYIAKLCAQGKLPAVKSGRRWLINKAKALQALGL